MCQKKNNSYANEFREEAVKLAIESYQPVAQCARKLGVNVNTLHTWMNKFHGDPPTPSGKQVNDVHMYEEPKQLLR